MSNTIKITEYLQNLSKKLYKILVKHLSKITLLNNLNIPTQIISIFFCSK